MTVSRLWPPQNALAKGRAISPPLARRTAAQQARVAAAHGVQRILMLAGLLADPESTRAVIAMGKRDVAFDAGLPMPKMHVRLGRRARPVDGQMDQHACMTVSADDDVWVGDLVGFDVSHPCLTFHKGRQSLIVDDDYRGLEVVKTFF